MLAYTVVLFGLAVSGLLPGGKPSSYLIFLLLAIAVWGYLLLRKAVRHVSDAPDELIDERQIAVRNAAYLSAYRWLAFVCVLIAAAQLSTANGGALEQVLDVAQRDRFVNGLYMTLMITAASLPAMVLGWQLPSEPEDEPMPSQPAA